MALYPPRQPATLQPRGDFEPEEFRRKIATFGADITWEAAYECPCGREVQNVTNNMTSFSLGSYVRTGDHKTECPLCKGAGYFLKDPQDIKGIVQGLRFNNTRTAPQGEYSNGSVSVTLFPENKPSYGDRLTVKNSVILIREARRRGPDTVESLRFPIASQVQDLATGPVSVDVVQVQKADASNSTSNAGNLVKGVDFDVTPAGKIDWTKGVANGHAPVLNATYTVSYYANPRYTVFDFGHGVRDTWDGMFRPTPKFQTMPLLVFARLEYLGAAGSRA